MRDKLYSVFKQDDNSFEEELVFSQKGFVKNKIYFKDLNLLILHFPERSYHFLVQGILKYQYHHGDEFTKFLKANGVACAEYHVEEVLDAKKGIYKKQDGTTFQISIAWIETGYDYAITDQDGKQPTLAFKTGKVGMIKIDPETPDVTVRFENQGNRSDPKIVKSLKGVKTARKYQIISGCLTVILMIAAFVLLGKIWTWIFGEPNDSFTNLLLPYLLK